MLKEISVRYNMYNLSKNFKKRIFTSLGLFILLITIFVSNFALAYVLIIAGIFSLLEFFNIIKLIFKKKKIFQIFCNLLFIIYIFCFCGIILIFSSILHLKFTIFILLLLCVMSDIGGFVFGKTFKGIKLTKISPNKTISGVLGSIVFSISFGLLIFYYLTNALDFKILLIAGMTSIGCQLGDLFFSFLKRKSSLKDTGNILPGHGGILDRIDGILLGIPVGFLFLVLTY